MERLFHAYNQCVTRVAQTNDRLEQQFKSTIRQDALEIAQCVQQNSRDLQHQGHSVEQVKHTLFDEVQGKVTHLDYSLCRVLDHLESITKTIDKNTHSRSASITALISEQEDLRRMVDDLARRLDQPREAGSALHGESSTAMQMEINDLRTKLLGLIEQDTIQDGKLSYLEIVSDQVNLMEDQIIKWRHRLPELTDDESKSVLCLLWM